MSWLVPGISSELSKPRYSSIRPKGWMCLFVKGTGFFLSCVSAVMSSRLSPNSLWGWLISLSLPLPGLTGIFSLLTNLPTEIGRIISQIIISGSFSA